MRTGVYYIRLQRDGWTMQPAALDDATTIFEKRVSPHWTLRKHARATTNAPEGRGCYYDEHELWNRRTDEKLPFPEWEWAELDRGRIVWAEDGKIMSGVLEPKGMTRTKLLYDCNLLQFERRVAPY